MDDREIIKKLTDEILSGKIKRDYLREEALMDFSGEYQAIYFSRARRALESEFAYVTMTTNQDLRDLEILKSMKLTKKRNKVNGKTFNNSNKK